MWKILIVEDHVTIAQELAKHLKAWGLDGILVNDFQNIMQEFSRTQPHLVLMDIYLPYHNGYYWCEEIRKHSNVPIVFISSAEDNMNKVMALNMGGDDYITKPFDLTLLVAKIKALLRRAYNYTEPQSELGIGSLWLDTKSMELVDSDNRIMLTHNEYKILRLLLEHKNKVITRETIMEHLWESESFVDDNTLTVNINRIRRKLEKIGYPDMIQTKRGVGYLIGECL